VIPTAPLAVRNRFAETVLAARHDPQARATLGELARRCAHGETGDWLDAAHATHAAALCARARAAVSALSERPLDAPAPSLSAVLDDARRLFDAHLYFEVHELLEPAWTRAAGGEREALQGLIQVAVGYQHLANGNAAGARALLADGAARLHTRALAGVALDAFARAVVDTAAAVPHVDWARVPAFPRPTRRERPWISS
jgi:predicted metal-dependent hydrolase